MGVQDTAPIASRCKVKTLIVLVALPLTLLLLATGCQQRPATKLEGQTPQDGRATATAGTIQVTATITGLEKGEEATLTISHEGSAASEELFFKRDVKSNGEKAMEFEITANLTDGYYQLLLEAPDKYFREPKGFFFMVSQSRIVNPSARSVIFNLLPKSEVSVAEAYLSLSAPPRTPPPPPPFEVRVVPEEAHYLPGEPIEIKLSITNVSSEPFTLNPYPWDIVVTPGKDYEKVLFSQAGSTQEKKIKPGEVVTVDFAWDQKGNVGNQVPPGWYNIRSREITVFSNEGGRVTRFTPGTRVLIQYPQGVMEKSFDLNQSQTASGITVTLERVELTADCSTFYFFFIPPGYTVPPTPNPPPPDSVTATRAEYTIGGTTKNADDAGFNTKGNGIKLVWGGVGPGKLDPVPSDAKEITFTITQLNDRQGPWVFRIRLQ